MTALTVSENSTLRELLAAAAAASSPASVPAAATAMLAGQVGAEVAAALSSALERVELLARSGRIGQHSLRALHEEISRARRVAMLGQQVSRLAAGHVRQAPEALELPQMLRDAIAQRADEIAARGVSVRQLLQPAAVSVDASLLFSLLLSLLDWALEHGCAQTLTLSTGLNAWPVHATLQCDFAWRAPDRLGPAAEAGFDTDDSDGDDTTSDLDTMAWRMVQQACRAMDVRIERQDSPCRVSLTLNFPETPRRWPQLLDDALVSDDVGSLGGGALAGCRLLVLATRPQTRRLLDDILPTLGVTADVVDDLQALRALAQGAAVDALVVDERSSEIDRVLAELKAGGSGPALVHLCGSSKGLEISTSGRFEIVRVGRDDLARELPAALRYALCAR